MTSRSSSPTRASWPPSAAPTKIIWGEDDEFAPVAGAHRLAAEIPGAEVAVIEGARHFVVEDAPDRYCEELAAFASSLAD